MDTGKSIWLIKEIKVIRYSSQWLENFSTIKIKITKNKKLITNKKLFKINTELYISVIFDLSFLLMDTSLVADKLKPKSINVLKKAITVCARTTIPNDSEPKTLTK